MKWVYRFNMEYDYEYDYEVLKEIEEIKVGDKVLVYSLYNANTGDETFYLSKRFAEDGYPGNIDSSIKCFHGFRGAYNNIYTCAHGVYTVKSVDTKGECKKVTLNHKDLKSKEN